MSRRPAGLLVFVGLVLAWVYTHGMTRHPLKWEEPRRALVAIEMIANDDFIAPTVLGKPYLKKPPLQNWLLVVAAGGDPARIGATALRGISLLSLAGICLFLWRLGFDGRGRGCSSVWPVLILLTMGVVFQSARAGEIDPLFCFFVVAAFGCFELGRRRGSAWQQWFLPQLFVAGGVLTKVAAPLFFYPPVLYWVWRRRRTERVAPLPSLLGLIAAAAIVALWLVPYSRVRSADALADRWVTEVLVRSTHKESLAVLLHLLLYPFLLVADMLPWSLAVVVRPRKSWRLWRERMTADPWIGLCATVVAWTAIVFLFLPEHKARYLLPAVPFFAVLVAVATFEWASAAAGADPWKLNKRFLGWVAAAVAWVLAAIRFGPELTGEAGSVALPTIVGVTVLSVFAIAELRRSRFVPARAVLALGLIYGVVFAGFLEAREARRGQRFVDAARQLAPAIVDPARPVVLHPACPLKFAYALTQELGRPLRRDAQGASRAYWIRPIEGIDAEGIADGGPYRLFSVDDPESWSWLAEPLFPPELPIATLERRKRRLEEARERFDASPSDTDAAIWLGRRTAYLGRYREAVAIYTEALERDPTDPRLYRHRGHRFITLRRLDDAVADLERATELIAGLPDRVEPDGLPNARGIPTSTLNSNIWYHLGLAHYLRGDLEQAVTSYRQAVGFSKNPDMLCAGSYWLYLSLRRSGGEAEARRVLEPIHADLDVIENHAYHRLLQVYRGELDADEVLADSVERGGLETATVGYGIAALHLLEGRRDEAIALLVRIRASGEWPAFGYAAAEADLARIGDRAL